jgi:NNP family nitrate/nitrite transporter-like MFS transporter
VAAFGADEGKRRQTVRDFHNKHTWSLTALYVVTFGSFIGFSMALPLAITVIFGFQPCAGCGGCDAACAEEPQRPLSTDLRLDRSLRGRRSPSHGRMDFRQMGGSIVTQVISAVLVGASIAVGWVLQPGLRVCHARAVLPLFMGLIILLSCRQRNWQRQRRSVRSA